MLKRFDPSIIKLNSFLFINNNFLCLFVCLFVFYEDDNSVRLVEKLIFREPTIDYDFNDYDSDEQESDTNVEGLSFVSDFKMYS